VKAKNAQEKSCWGKGTSGEEESGEGRYEADAEEENKGLAQHLYGCPGNRY